jgi:hypothetical protein
VLIQLPMYNEDAHCDLIIQRCCKIKWPSHRILIQVGLVTAAGLVTSQRSTCRNSASSIMQAASCYICLVSSVVTPRMHL